MFGIDEYANEMKLGHGVTVAALVIALDECGVVPKRRYSEILHRLWAEMPEEKALGEAGAAIEQVLDLLGKDAVLDSPTNDAEQEQEIRTFASKGDNDDSYVKFARKSLKALLQV